MKEERRYEEEIELRHREEGGGLVTVASALIGRW